MIFSKFASFISLVAVTGIVLVANAQQAPDATKTPDATTDSAPPPAAPPAAPAPSTAPPTTTEVKATGPSPDTVKKAKSAGYRAKLRRGETLFCKEQTEIGSHFSSEHCIDEAQLGLVLEREQAQRDQMTQRACGGSGACGGK